MSIINVTKEKNKEHF